MAVSDGNIEFSGGQNDGLLPDRIEKGQYRRAVNVTTKNGTLSPRPGFAHVPLDMVPQGEVQGRTYSQIFRSGKFQGACAYESDEGRFILAFISGLVFRIDPRNRKIDLLSLPDEDRMSQYRRRLHWSYAGRFVTVFDYPNLPVIIEGDEIRRTDPERQSAVGTWIPEVPTAVLGAFVQGRLFVANAGNEFLAGDPVGGGNSDAPITFEECLAPASSYLGQSFSLGSQPANRTITAMGFLQTADTSTGVGPLIVTTRNSIYASRADLPRSQWEQELFNRMLLFKAGIPGPQAFDNQNADLVFLSGQNEVRSLFQGRSDEAKWSDTPISREIAPWLQEFADLDLLDLAIVVGHKNRIFVSVAPYRTQALSLDGVPVMDYAHGGLAVLELDNVSRLGAQAAPAWAGLWTGISPVAAVTVGDDLYFFSKDDGGINNLYRLDESASWDTYEDKEQDIVARITTRDYDFDSPLQDKQIESIDYSLSNISGDFKFLAEYKAAHSEQWRVWGEFSHTARTTLCDADTAQEEAEMPILATHSFRQLNLGDPEEKMCDPLTGDLELTARKLGLRLTVRGRSWSLSSIRLRGQVQEDSESVSVKKCATLEEAVEIEQEISDWEFYRTATKDAKWPSPISIL